METNPKVKLTVEILSANGGYVVTVTKTGNGFSSETYIEHTLDKVHSLVSGMLETAKERGAL